MRKGLGLKFARDKRLVVFGLAVLTRATWTTDEGRSFHSISQHN
jgi:hypothetical protein